MSNVDIQMGIVGYLRGETYTYMTSVDKALALDKLSKFGFSLTRATCDDLRERVVELNSAELAFKLDANGLNIPQTCKGCKNFDSSLDSHISEKDANIIFRSKFRCVRSGCDKVREKFLQNMGELKAKGEARIDLEVIAPTRSIANYSMSGVEMAMSRSFDERIEIIGTPSLAKHDFFSSGEIPSYSKVSKWSEKTFDKPQEEIEREIESDVDRLMRDKPFDYGVDAW